MRPRKCRHIAVDPAVTVFKPAGIPARDLQWITLTLEEAEALRLADLEQLYHEEAGRRMGVSRQTFSRIVQQARKKVAEALIEGKCLAIGKSDPDNTGNAQ